MIKTILLIAIAAQAGLPDLSLTFTVTSQNCLEPIRGRRARRRIVSGFARTVLQCPDNKSVQFISSLKELADQALSVQVQDFLAERFLL